MKGKYWVMAIVAIILLILLLISLKLALVSPFTVIAVLKMVVVWIGGVIALWGSTLISMRIIEICGNVESIMLELLLMVVLITIYVGLPFISAVGLLTIMFGG